MLKSVVPIFAGVENEARLRGAVSLASLKRANRE
jgi:hypothetical protein